MKRLLLVLVAVLALTLATAAPAFAFPGAGGPGNGACACIVGDVASGGAVSSAPSRGAINCQYADSVTPG